ncbi:MAG TPA: hypothetical protein PLD47_06205 [Aggregatilineales bacterium]|nr:hypothetical protein [Anaerolineales bacterium]HRE47302.1 hypothetical protein [Aggregatilineales bacterium]
MADQPNPESSPSGNLQGVYVDRLFTVRVTVASLIVGIFGAALAAWVLLSFLRPGEADPNQPGTPAWSVTQIVLPLTFIVSGGILFWAVFNLPVRIAKRRGVVLDPDIFPWTGAVLVGVIVAIGFVIGMLTGRI